MIRSRDEFNQISEKVINGTANKSEQKAYEDFIRALDRLIHDWHIWHSADEKPPVDKMMESLFSSTNNSSPLDNLYDHFKDDPNVDQNFLKYRIAREKEKRTFRYKIRCFLAKFHR